MCKRVRDLKCVPDLSTVPSLILLMGVVVPFCIFHDGLPFNCQRRFSDGAGTSVYLQLFFGLLDIIQLPDVNLEDCQGLVLAQRRIVEADVNAGFECLI
jgi:hypothetical protein